MTHTRRKFHEALDNDEEHANYASKEIQKLYIMERIYKVKQLNFEELKEVRQKISSDPERPGRLTVSIICASATKTEIGKAIGCDLQR